MSFSVLIFVVLRLSHGNEVFADEIFLFMTLQKAMTGKDVDVHELGRLTVAWFLEDLGSMSLGAIGNQASEEPHFSLLLVFGGLELEPVGEDGSTPAHHPLGRHG
ncbi:hypothetical protein JHK84_045192 [Glycine max]|nr:hypothetical protein JHK86_045134 [Glycine max]KAG5108285.1 hypothetical protein JHK84_045192 [Glycine max]